MFPPPAPAPALAGGTARCEDGVGMDVCGLCGGRCLDVARCGTGTADCPAIMRSGADRGVGGADAVMGARGGDACPGGSARITDEAECRAVAAATPGANFRSAGCYHMKTVGCLDNGSASSISSLYYNTCTASSTRHNHAPVCKPAGAPLASLVQSGVKCSNTAAATNAGVNNFGHCEAGNGGAFEDCAACVRANAACSSAVTSWQPENAAHYCKCVAAGDDCAARSGDSNYNVYRLAAEAAAGGTPATGYKFTQGYCRGGPAWSGIGELWDCLEGTHGGSRPKKTEEQCQAECDARETCGAFDMAAGSGARECCLFQPGNSGDGGGGRFCMVKLKLPCASGYAAAPGGERCYKVVAAKKTWHVTCLCRPANGGASVWGR